MDPNQESPKVRLTDRQRESVERRSRMTKRRRELTNRIRKQKKNEYLQKKRCLPYAVVDSSAGKRNPAAFPEFKGLLESYCQNSLSPEQLLLSLHSEENRNTFSFDGTTRSEYLPVVLEQEDERMAVQFLDCLRKGTVDSLTNKETSYFQTALKILVHLTSISSGDGMVSSDTNYYGRRPSTWSEILVSPSPSEASPTQMTSMTPSWMEILSQSLLSSNEVELTSLVLGNIAGDDVAARKMFQAMSSDFKSSLVAGLIRSVSPTTPTAAWTLTNMIRNDFVSYATTYCSERLLSASLLMAWLREPFLATQTAWMIASLTAREEQTVNYLCGMVNGKQENQASFLSAIVKSIENPLQPDQPFPLVQALGNLACHSFLVGPLLTQTMPNLIPILKGILSTTPSRDPLLIQSAWLAGCLLVDVGLKDHPSTNIAAPALVPTLMGRLDGGYKKQEIPGPLMTRMTFEEEREFVSALWNALDDPPSVHKEHVQPSLIHNQSLSSPVQLPFVLKVTRPTLQSLVRLLNSNDSDAVLSGVHVVDLLLRRETNNSYLQIIMQEEELPDSLERICDSPMEEASFVAADILDDFFSDEFHNDNRDVECLPSWTDGPQPFTLPTFQVANGSGRGRGRGATMPAWMTK